MSYECTPLTTHNSKLRTVLTGELIRIDPLHGKQRPEVHGQLAQYVLIGHPAIAVVTPGRAPRVTDQQSARCLAVIRRVFDFLVVVVSDGGDGVSPLSAFARAWKRDSAGDIGVVERVESPETEHGGYSGGQILFDAGKHGRGRHVRSQRIVAEIFEGL